MIGLQEGDVVEIHSLATAVQHNGRMIELLLYLAQKERWVVRPLSNPCDGFLSLKATNLSLKPRNTIVVLLANYSVHQYFVVQRLDYLCEVKEWGAVETMHNQAVEMAAELRAKWPNGACKIYANLALQSEMLGNTQKTIHFLAQELAIAEELLAKKERENVPANLYCKLGSLYFGTGQHELAIKMSEKARTISESTGNLADVASCSSNLGHAHAKLGNWILAIRAHEKDLEVSRQRCDEEGQEMAESELKIFYAKV